MKKLMIWVGGMGAVMLVVIGHFVVFGVTDTGYEKWLRSQVASMLRGLSTLDSNDFQYPVVVDQSYLIEDSLVAMSENLVYPEGDVVSVLTLSRDAGTMPVSARRSACTDDCRTWGVSCKQDGRLYDRPQSHRI